jgi:hypothetical protein
MANEVVPIKLKKLVSATVRMSDIAYSVVVVKNPAAIKKEHTKNPSKFS